MSKKVFSITNRLLLLAITSILLAIGAEVKAAPALRGSFTVKQAEDPELRQFGDERLLSILRNTHFDTAQQVIETLAADVAAHRNGAEPNDDLTMLCLRVS